MIKEKMGLIAAIIFSIGILSFMNSPQEKTDTEKSKAKIIEIVDSTKSQGSFGGYHDEIVELTSNFMFSINMRFTFARYNNTGELKLLTAHVFPTGMLGSSNWKPENVTIMKMDSITYDYEVYGVIESTLFGKAVISNNKNYSGTLKLKGTE